MPIACLEQGPLCRDWNIQRRTGNQFLVVHVARVRKRRIAIKSSLCWRHSHAAEKWMQWEIDSGREMSNHLCPIQWNYLRTGVRILHGEEPMVKAKSVACVVHIKLYIQDLYLEHVAWLGFLDRHRPSKYGASGSLVRGGQP